MSEPRRLFVLDWAARMSAWPFSPLPTHLVKRKCSPWRKRAPVRDNIPEAVYPVISVATTINPVRQNPFD